MSSLDALFKNHSRNFANFKYVYPVISRRAKGLSIGINLNPENFCNFACVYCCVLERNQGMKSAPVDLDILAEELKVMLHSVADGSFWKHERFAQTPDDWRKLKDITFAGNGEPTSSPNFKEAVDLAFEIRKQLVPDVKIVLLTNATLLGQSKVLGTMQAFVNSTDEVWAKLDAGTDNGLKRINRSKTSLSTILSNILNWGQINPVVIQSLFCRFEDEDMDWIEYHAWLDRIGDLFSQGIQFKRVQIYTVARDTMMPGWNPLAKEWMLEMQSLFEQRFPQIPLQVVLP